MPFMSALVDTPSGSTSTTSTSLVDAGCTVSVASGVQETFDIMVAYRANFGGNDNAQVGEAICLHTDSSVVLGQASAESNGGSVHYSGGQLQGFARVTVNANHNIKLRHRNITSSDTNFTGSRGIVGIYLAQPHDIFNDGVDDFDLPHVVTCVENSDFFYSGTNSASAETAAIGNTWTTVRTVDFTLPSAGNYRIFFSAEATMSGGSATDGAQCRFQIDGTTQGAEWVREWEDDGDRPNFAYTDVVSLSAGSRTFRVQMQNRNPLSIVLPFRSRIWAFRADSFLAGSQDVETTGDSAVTHTTYSDSDIFMSTPYTAFLPTEQVLGFATLCMGSSGVNMLAEIVDLNGGTERCLDAGYALNDSGLGSDDDLMPTVLFQSSSVDPSDSAGFKVRTRIDVAGTGTAGRNAANSAGVRCNLQVWPMFKLENDPLLLDGVLATTR